MPRARLRIFCLEGEWESELTDQQSVQPLLEVLKHAGGADYIHRRVATEAELDRLLGRWRGHTSYEVLYLASHGESGALTLGEGDPVPLERLSEKLQDSCEDAVVHLSGCQTLRASDRSVRRFLDQTGAEAVCGYRRLVDWVPGAAMDLVLFHALAERLSKARRPSVAAALAALWDNHWQLAGVTSFDYAVKEGRGSRLAEERRGS
ncbi:MAG: hypothetical protein M3N16_03070 [Actinomycetota bacterium]|nr:hypothetical protein [Actinomycetota bacterium]